MVTRLQPIARVCAPLRSAERLRDLHDRDRGLVGPPVLGEPRDVRVGDDRAVGGHGQLTESRVIMDVMGLLTQLGAIPAPAAN
jgi:hypothetical protein